jgi:hypothetical protein
MVLIGMSILPHGSMILDPTALDVPSGCDELHTAAKYVGDYLRDHEPDIVLLATPHGINISDSIGETHWIYSLTKLKRIYLNAYVGIVSPPLRLRQGFLDYPSIPIKSPRLESYHGSFLGKCEYTIHSDTIPNRFMAIESPGICLSYVSFIDTLILELRCMIM